MRSQDLTNTSIFSHADLGSGDLILLICAAVKLELFFELIAVSVWEVSSSFQNRIHFVLQCLHST